MTYRIFTDATADFSMKMMNELPGFSIFPMDITLGDIPYTYGPGGNISVSEFYATQRSGKFASTSQINPVTYLQGFREYLQQGMYILYLCFSSGLSGTYQTACMCAEELRDEFPERKIYCIDTLCASVGEGFFVREALRKQAEGMKIEELAHWVIEYRLKVCHWFTVDTFEHLRHGGRVSAATASIGTVLNIKPLLHVSNSGHLEATEKPRGQKKAMASQIAHMKEGWLPDISPLVLIGHGDCPERAEELSALVQQHFPQAEVYTTPIGPIIGSHTGPGVLALIYWGDNR